MENLTNKFVGGLRRNEISDTFIYYNMFSILQITNPDFLEEIMTNYETHPDDWFRIFHKSLRQFDFFNSDRISYTRWDNQTSKEEEQERNDILNFRKQFRRTHDFDEMNNEYTEKGKRLGVINRKRNVLVKDNDENVSGHLDSILYELISSGKDELYHYMNKFFKENK